MSIKENQLAELAAQLDKCSSCHLRNDCQAPVGWYGCPDSPIVFIGEGPGGVEGIGAADHAVIGLYDVGQRQYHKTELNGPMEITSLLGNITQKDGAVYLHLHINLCNKEMQILGGHLNECRIGATGEIIVRTLPGNVDRLLDEKVTGLNLFRFV